MSSKRDRAVSLGGDEGGSGGNDRLRRSKSASTLKEEKKKESKGFVLFIGPAHSLSMLLIVY